MKKILLVGITMLTLTVATQAANSPAGIPANAIGARLGGGFGNGGAELSYQKAMGTANRIELDLGWSGHKDWSYLGLAGIYQWDWNITKGLNWFVGPGAAVGLYSGSGRDDDGVSLAIGGQIGLDYNFNTLGAPILVGLDLRPMWGFITHGGSGADAALSVRYTF